MVYYFSRSGRTEVFAQVLAEHLGMQAVRLRSSYDALSRMKSIFSAMRMCFGGKIPAVENMPDGMPPEIWLCGPVWGGQLRGAAEYFLKNAHLSGIVCNILLTASMPTRDHVRKTQARLAKIDCIPGKCLIFATSKAAIERDVVQEQLEQMLADNT